MAKLGDILYTGTPEKCRELLGKLEAGELTKGDMKELYAKAQEAQPAAEPGQETPEQTPQLTPDTRMTGEQIRTPRGSFSVTDMTAEQMREAGYGLHHTSEDGKYLIMGNGTQAFAIAAEQPEKVNPLKHVENAIEQNDNHFDGIINNTPTSTADELEAKARSGEQISLAEYVAALKADKEQGKKAEPGKKPEKKPSVRAQLAQDQKRTAPKKAAAKTKNHGLEV